MDWLKKYFTVIVTIAGWVFTLGISMAKLNNAEKEIESLKSRQTTYETSLNDINKTLTSIDTKVNLLLDNKIKIEEK